MGRPKADLVRGGGAVEEEETWGTGLTTGIKLVSGIGTSMNLQYTLPTVLGTTIAVAYAPAVGVADTADKTSGVSENEKGKGYDATININPSMGFEILSGLNLFVGAHYTENLNETENDKYEGVAGATLDIGPISLGYATSGVSTGQEANTEVDYYKNHMYGVAFNINDNLSISYGYHESQQGFVNPTLTQAVHMDMDSYQIAYTIGGASIRYAATEVNNAAYQTTPGYDKEADVLLSLIHI